MLCLVNSTLPSPVFAKPTTSPYPTSWFVLTPAIDAISLILSARTKLLENVKKQNIKIKNFFII